MNSLRRKISVCTICQNLPLGPRPILQIDSRAKILIAGQAPGRITHQKGKPFDDASGNRLREWLGIEKKQFYNATNIAIVPMGFCFPGTGKSGDLPPRTECAKHWHQAVLSRFDQLELTLVIGQYALDYHLQDRQKKTLTKTVENWKEYWPRYLPLPHPSPRNNRWLSNNPWFKKQVIPKLQKRIAQLLLK